MKTTDFTTPINSVKLKENMNKFFGVNVKFEAYSREQLEDMRNKIRTRIFQQENAVGMNDLLTNETYQKDQALLKLLNTRIKEMLGEDIKKLRDKMDELSEAKKGVKAPKYIRHAKGSVGSSSRDQTGDGKKDFDDVQVARMTAGGVPKKKAIAKATSDNFEENRVVKGRAYGGSAQKDTDYVHSDTPSKGSSEKSADDRARDKAADRERERSGRDWEARGYKRTVVKGKSQSGSPKDDDLDEAAARLPAKKKDTTWTDKSGKKHSATKVQGHASRAADKEADKEKKASNKDLEETKDAKCNHTAKGKLCSVHGLKECGTMEGKDEGKPGKNFAKIAKKAGAKYGSKEAGERVAGAVRQKMKKAGKLEESNLAFKQAVKLVNEGLMRLLAEDEEGKAKAITAAGDMVNDFTSWMQRVGQYQTKSMIELADAIRADFGTAEAEAFKQAVGPALGATLEVLTQQRETISNAVATLAGETPMTEPMGAEPAMGPEEPGMEPASPDMMNEPAGDEFGASDAAAGAGTSGREMRESKFSQKLAESHSIMSKLAR